LQERDGFINVGLASGRDTNFYGRHTTRLAIGRATRVQTSSQVRPNALYRKVEFREKCKKNNFSLMLASNTHVSKTDDTVK